MREQTPVQGDRWPRPIRDVPRPEADLTRGAPGQDEAYESWRRQPRAPRWRESELSGRRRPASPVPDGPSRRRPDPHDGRPYDQYGRPAYDEYDGRPYHEYDRRPYDEYDRRPYDGNGSRTYESGNPAYDEYEGRSGDEYDGPYDDREDLRPYHSPPSGYPTHRRVRDTFWERRSRRRARRSQARSERRTVVGRHPYLSAWCAVILALTPVWVSLAGALANPGLGISVSARGAEWFRLHGGSGIVNWAENLWYSHHPPPVGGKPAQGSIPDLRSSAKGISAKSGPAHLPVPARLTSPAGSWLPGEGLWHPVGRLVGGVPAVYETWVRPDAVHTSLVIGVAWMDTKLLQTTLYSGSTIPGGGPYRHSAPVSGKAARSLVAAFNAGFLMDNANGGYYTDGRTIMRLRTGAASFVIYRNGSVNIFDWGRNVSLTPDIVSVRQNLDLLVDHGKPVTGLNPNDTTQWGFTLGNAVYVWRSGVGITADGALIYVGGPGLNITTLADILARAGAVRAMELDINTDWVNFAAYDPRSPAGRATPANGSDLLPGMFGKPDRYFESWWSRDFFTMSARMP